MAATWIPSNALAGPQPIISNGQSMAVNAVAMFPAGPYGAVFPVSGDALHLRCIKTGTLTADCAMEVWFALDDGATQFGVSQSYPYAQINNADGFAVRVPVAGKWARIFLRAGTMTGANGIVVSVRA